jgi:hypothetical protein
MIEHDPDTIARDNKGRTPADRILRTARPDLAEGL